ncbi:MAG TPA: hypothetical protein VE844_01465, partial [Gammaproteobacteria bacterium]|nr:hypothetical protein [Gammaproteobacteria bacterium]
MAFDVYPASHSTPLDVAAAGSSPLIAIKEELIGVDPDTGLNKMFIRAVKLGAGCAPSGPPHPTIRLKADTGDAVDLLPASAVSIFNQPGGTGTEVANAILDVETDDVYRVRVFIFQPDSNWQIQIVNNDPAAAHGFTWVVSDTDAHTRQPWIDIPTTLEFDVLTGQAATRSLQITNHGTGPLTIADNTGFSPGTGFVLTTVPGAVNPNACADLQITFTAPDTPGTTQAVYTITSNDTTAQPTPGHNHQTQLSATTRR